MNLDKLDKIVFRNKEEMQKLFDWKDMNKDLVRNYKPVLHEGLIVYHTPEKLDMDVYFQEENNIVTLKVNLDNLHVVTVIIEYRKSEGGYVVLHEWFHKMYYNSSEDSRTSARADFVTLHASLMAYMEHYTEYISETKERSTKIKKGKGGNKNKNRSVKIGRKVYEVSVPQSVLTEKRNYERHTDAWKQRGHWRTYKKSGKRVWIAEQVKGDKNKSPEPKLYHI